jgi:hypothetical protein
MGREGSSTVEYQKAVRNETRVAVVANAWATWYWDRWRSLLNCDVLFVKDSDDSSEGFQGNLPHKRRYFGFMSRSEFGYLFVYSCGVLWQSNPSCKQSYWLSWYRLRNLQQPESGCSYCPGDRRETWLEPHTSVAFKLTWHRSVARVMGGPCICYKTNFVVKNYCRIIFVTNIRKHVGNVNVKTEFLSHALH